MIFNTSILSRHRLPQPYRTTIVVLWVLPAVLLFGAVWIGNNFTLEVFHPRLLIALFAMGLPALYIWQEGIDVTPDALVVRIRGWRTLRYDALDTYYLHNYRGGRVLKIWDVKNRRVVSVYAAHLTDLPVLLRTLKSRLRWRGWHV